MKFVTEYRDSEQAKGIAAELAATVDPNREYRFMEFCGGHTHVLAAGVSRTSCRRTSI